jgi:hypothetical protein
MSPDLIRALTPPFLAACGVAVFAIAVVGKVDNNAFNQVSNIVSACLGGAAGASMHSSGGGNISAREIENVDVDRAS